MPILVVNKSYHVLSACYRQGTKLSTLYAFTPQPLQIQAVIPTMTNKETATEKR